MEIFRTECSYVLLCGESSLWVDKISGELCVKPAWELANGHDPECLGIFFGLIGRIRRANLIEDHILLVKESVLVGELPSGHAVHKIKSVALLSPSLEVSQELGLKRCPKHHRTSDNNVELNTSNSAISKRWTSFKTATTNIKSSAQQSSHLQNIGKGRNDTKESKEKERYQRRITDELHRIFTDTDSFYFCPAGGDITNSVYRQHKRGSENADDELITSYIDDRFFWNKHMLHDVMRLESRLAEVWVMPIIQGYVEIKECKLDFGEHQKYEVFTVSLISRRSRHRVGTRYRRRGVDEHGHCANYVETEQIVKYKKHVVSFVQIRGSIPLYWSQQGYKYRPPPQLHKSNEENQTTMEKHMNEELERYGPIVIVNLVERSGKEAVIGDAYANHICEFNNSDITYVAFDFHHYCRGMRFENVTLLTDELQDEIAKMNYCWLDNHGLISKQNGIFRVNCVDCLDRTNIVQTALAREVLIVQLIKLGLMSPEAPNHLFLITQQMWANNGDIISKQYAGTNALKGDITRTGGRKISGMMKDGMNSANRYIRNYYEDYYTQMCLDLMQGNLLTENADMFVKLFDNVASPLLDQFTVPLYPISCSGNDFFLINELRSIEFGYLFSRYYLSRFKDLTRQATLDIMLGNPLEDGAINPKGSSSEDEDEEAIVNEVEKSIDHIKQVIDDVKNIILEDPSHVLAAWGLISADLQSTDVSRRDMDTILVLTRCSFFIVEYDPEMDKLTKFEETSLRATRYLEILVWDTSSSNSTSAQQKISPRRRNESPVLCIHFVPDLQNTRFVVQRNFRSTNVRFFNNLAVVIKNNEEKIESLRAIAETIQATYKVCGLGDLQLNVNVVQKKGSLLSSDLYNFKPSDAQLSSLKNAGTKALSNVSQQFSKFNKFGQSFKSRNKSKNEKLETASPDTNINKMSDPPLETFLPTAGIVLSNTDIEPIIRYQETLPVNDDHLFPLSLNTSSMAPKIVIDNEKQHTIETIEPNSNRSQSSENISTEQAIDSSLQNKTNSFKDLSLNLPSFHGETTFQSLKSGFTTATNALVSPSSPLSKLAKGVQNLGSNLDPRKFKPVRMNTSYSRAVPQVAENLKLQEKWASADCCSKLITI